MVMKFNKRFYKNLEKEKDLMNNHPIRKEKIPQKVRKLNALIVEI